MKKIGSVFDQTSTTEFVVMLNQQYDGEKLLFSYVELSFNGNQPQPNDERIIARIINVYKENPLLSRDQAGVAASIDVGGLGFEFARRFTYGWAKCSVIGTLVAGRLDVNRRGVAPNAAVYTPSDDTLRQLFFMPSPSYVPLGSIETFADRDVTNVPVTLNADQLVTKHFCIFGMTGSGKTTTAARLLEELMARDHRMIIFDSHDDYQNLEQFSNLFIDIDSNGQRQALPCRVGNRQCAAVQSAMQKLNIAASNNRPPNELICERLIRTASVIYANEPARQIIRGRCQQVTEQLVDQLLPIPQWKNVLENPRMMDVRGFPELKYYGPDFTDFSIALLQAFQGESFSSAQWRCLSQCISQPGTGIRYLQNLSNEVENTRAQEDTKGVLQQMLGRLQGIYADALKTGATPLNLDRFFIRVVDKQQSLPQSVYRLSLSDLSSNLRKAMVYAVVTYFFRSFKFGDYRVRPAGNQKAAHSVLFVLEEARSLVPKPSGDDNDVAGMLARRAMRELAYEGRKFSIGYGLISQKPSTVDPEVVSQANTFILHQLKSPEDQEYVRAVTESMSRDELEMVKSLGTGRAIVAGVAVQSPVLLHIYPRYSEEGIQEPTPIQDALTSVAQIRQQLQSSKNS
jgi:hypothetical protein